MMCWKALCKLDIVSVKVTVGISCACLPTPSCEAPGRNVSFARVPRFPQRSQRGAHRVGAFLVTISEPLASNCRRLGAVTPLGSLLEMHTLRPQSQPAELESAFK